MAGLSIRLTIPSENTHTPSNGAVELMLVVENVGGEDTRCAIVVHGLPTSWYDLDTDVFTLAPGATARARLTAHPPRDTIGRYPFRVWARSDQTPPQQVSTVAALLVGADGLAAFDLQLLETWRRAEAAAYVPAVARTIAGGPRYRPLQALPRSPWLLGWGIGLLLALPVLGLVLITSYSAPTATRVAYTGGVSSPASLTTMPPVRSDRAAGRAILSMRRRPTATSSPHLAVGGTRVSPHPHIGETTVPGRRSARQSPTLRPASTPQPRPSAPGSRLVVQRLSTAPTMTHSATAAATATATAAATTAATATPDVKKDTPAHVVAAVMMVQSAHGSAAAGRQRQRGSSGHRRASGPIQRRVARHVQTRQSMRRSIQSRATTRRRGLDRRVRQPGAARRAHPLRQSRRSKAPVRPPRRTAAHARQAAIKRPMRVVHKAAPAARSATGLRVAWPSNGILRFERPRALSLVTRPYAPVAVTLLLRVPERGVGGRTITQTYRYVAHATADAAGRATVPLRYAYIPTRELHGILTVATWLGGHTLRHSVPIVVTRR